MITCHQAKENLEAYYDGECPESLRQELVSHLSGCKACQASLNEWIALSAKVFRPGEAKAPPFLWTRVLAGIEAQEANRGAWWLEWRWMTRVTVAAGLAVILGSAYLLRSTEPPLEVALEGSSKQESAIQLAKAYPTDPNDSLNAVMERETWVEN